MMRIDIDNVLRERVPRYHRYIPRWTVRWLERIICQDRLNYILEHNYPATGADFADGALRDMDVTYDFAGKVPDQSNRRVIIVSNHPLGGLDGLVLASAARRVYGGSAEDVKFVVNDLLDFVEPLRSIFLGVNKHGAQSREGADSIDKAFAGDEPIIMFPAGLVSRMGKDGKIADLDWHKMAVVRAISYHRDIIPVHFSGVNSRFFYKFAQLRSRLGLRFNIEMIRLPKEMILSEGSHYTITFGSPVPWDELRGGKEALAQADKLRSIVYKLPSQ